MNRPTTQRTRDFFLLPGIPKPACSGVFIGEDAHQSVRPAAQLQGRCCSRLVAASAALLCTALAAAQAPARPARPDPSTFITKTFALHTAALPNDGNETLTALRLMLDPAAKLYLQSSQQILIVQASPSDLALAEKLITEFDQPPKPFKSVYTITERDGTRVVGVQHFTMYMVTGTRTILKSGSKVPIVTGSVTQDNQTQNQMTYLDIGLNFDATIESSRDLVRLNSKVEQSSVAEERSGLGPADPVVRQTLLQGTSILTPGKPTLLGSIDTPGSNRHLDVEVVLEPVK